MGKLEVYAFCTLVHRAWVIQEVGLACDLLCSTAASIVALKVEDTDAGVGVLILRDSTCWSCGTNCVPTLSSRWGVEFSTIHGDWLDWTISGTEAWKGDLDRHFWTR